MSTARVSWRTERAMETGTRAASALARFLALLIVLTTLRGFRLFFVGVGVGVTGALRSSGIGNDTGEGSGVGYAAALAVVVVVLIPVTMRVIRRLFTRQLVCGSRGHVVTGRVFRLTLWPAVLTAFVSVSVPSQLHFHSLRICDLAIPTPHILPQHLPLKVLHLALARHTTWVPPELGDSPTRSAQCATVPLHAVLVDNSTALSPTSCHRIGLLGSAGWDNPPLTLYWKRTLCFGGGVPYPSDLSPRHIRLC
ncbi:hypothetical protein EXIGLDRAFT_519682 [Exidia glandulosa HHB12029]|uniref:Uncharacterized protein n=1 Tax=Exidia glandulosa HHB12029 TaxID=1314781 RepID=A0A166N165_EXIGL|nr:hypothetical protein EXIGLDRAFT_519682 [Exidia glandulosa HHB12029]